MKQYEGRRQGFAAIVTMNGQRLDPRLDLWNHNSSFEWGYIGTGPAQLALAILADHCSNEQEALDFYQRFKWAVVAQLPTRGWTLTNQDIDRVLQNLREVEPVLKELA